MFCTRCGCELVGGARFCHNCGEQVKAMIPLQPTASERKQVDHAIGELTDASCEMQHYATTEDSKNTQMARAMAVLPNIRLFIQNNWVSDENYDWICKACGQMGINL